jgi:hypothetical protein
LSRRCRTSHGCEIELDRVSRICVGSKITDRSCGVDCSGSETCFARVCCSVGDAREALLLSRNITESCEEAHTEQKDERDAHFLLFKFLKGKKKGNLFFFKERFEKTLFLRNKNFLIFQKKILARITKKKKKKKKKNICEQKK